MVRLLFSTTVMPLRRDWASFYIRNYNTGLWIRDNMITDEKLIRIYKEMVMYCRQGYHS
jgi:hypothetical protein